MRKILLVLVILLASNLYAQKNTIVKSTFDYSKFEGLWYNENTVTLFVRKEKNGYKVTEFSVNTGRPLDVISMSFEDNRMYVETVFKSNNTYIFQEFSYVDNDTLYLHISGDERGTAIFTRYNYNTFNPLFLARTND
jgi:hypothetical protein